MQNALINILIRTSHRPDLFKRCIESVEAQTYKNIRIIIGHDQESARDYIPVKYEAYKMPINDLQSFYWNLHCNHLKSFVTEGWFFYLDDDDYLYSETSLESISTKLIDPSYGVICQMLRRGRPKPPGDYIENKKIVKGKIGNPCLFLHHSQKDIAYFDGEKAADYRWIKDVEKVLPLQFYPQVVVRTGNNGLKGK